MPAVVPQRITDMHLPHMISATLRSAVAYRGPGGGPCAGYCNRDDGGLRTGHACSRVPGGAPPGGSSKGAARRDHRGRLGGGGGGSGNRGETDGVAREAARTLMFLL